MLDKKNLEATYEAQQQIGGRNDNMEGCYFFPEINQNVWNNLNTSYVTIKPFKQ